jgi:hypothetical protein
MVRDQARSLGYASGGGVTKQAGDRRPWPLSRVDLRARTQPTSAPWDKTLQSWNPIVVVVLAILGAGGSVLLLLINADATTSSARFIQSAGFPLWAAVIAAQTAVWAVITVPLWREIISTYRATKPSWSIWLVPAFVVAALVALAVLSPAREAPWPLWGHHLKAWTLTAAAAIGVGVPAIFGIAIVQDRVRRHEPAKLTERDIERALDARAQMKRFLGTAGAVISLAVLASGALRLATVPEFIKESKFPASSVLLYGAFFTALLLIVYVPAYLSLRRLCLDIREHFFPVETMPPPTSAEFSAWVDGRNRLDTLTQVNVTAGQQVQASVFILAPLLSGLLGALLPAL